MEDNQIADLYRDEYERLTRWIARRIGSDDAADLASKCFVKLIDAAQKRRIDEPTAYLYRIARNAIIDRKRRQESRRRMIARQSPTAGEPYQPAPTAQILARLELGHYMRRAHLTAGNERAIIYAYYYEMTNDQIAEMVGKTANAVRADLHRATTKLRAAAGIEFSAEELAAIGQQRSHRTLQRAWEREDRQ